MSAFVVSDECMGVILAAIKRYADELPVYFGEFSQDYILNWLGNNLLAFNWESVNTRYKEKDPYVYRKLEAKKLSDDFKDTILEFKQVECWRYQSNECEGYFYCWQFDLMDRLGELLCKTILEMLGEKSTGDKLKDTNIVKDTLTYRQCEMWG